jgi:predicted aconitase
MREIADRLAGRKVKARLWVMAAPHVAAQAAKAGISQRIRASGGELTIGACAIVAPMKQTGIRSVATDSAKGAFYHSSYNGLDIHVGNIAQCIEAAVTGMWPG